MARWMLDCGQCGQEFTQSEISDDAWSPLDPYTWSVVKPIFPLEGLKAICPHCKGESIYERHQLIYRAHA